MERLRVHARPFLSAIPGRRGVMMMDLKAEMSMYGGCVCVW